MLNDPKPHHSLFDKLWDLWCCLSIIGIWPRFIEPNLLSVSNLLLPIQNLHPDLHNLKIVQFSDLHLHPGVPESYLKKIERKILAQKPDLIVFTGDFLCDSKLYEGERLQSFLCNLKAKYGCFTTLGNHDYEFPLTISSEGFYDLADNQKKMAPILKGFQRLFSSQKVEGKASKRAKFLKPHPALQELLKQTPFHLLYNKTASIKIGKAILNICGLGEYMTGQCNPEEAFSSYDQNNPGIILSHNPDTFPLLQGYPGEIILSGHTHGGQVNLPWMWNKFLLLENPQFKRGLHRQGEQILYVNRGVGSTLPFRWFSTPEILSLKLVSNCVNSYTFGQRESSRD